LRQRGRERDRERETDSSRRVWKAGRGDGGTVIPNYSRWDRLSELSISRKAEEGDVWLALSPSL
jgi:hypothetical protein